MAEDRETKETLVSDSDLDSISQTPNGHFGKRTLPDDLSEDKSQAAKKAKLLEERAQLEAYIERLQSAIAAERLRQGLAGPALLDTTALYAAPQKKNKTPAPKNKRREPEVYVAPEPLKIEDDVMNPAVARDCLRIVEDLLKNKVSEFFRVPVDWQAWKLWDYPEIIKNPMDLGTIREKLKDQVYITLSGFTADVQLVWDNARLYNPAGTVVHQAAIQAESVFLKKFSALQRDKKRSVVQTEPEDIFLNAYEKTRKKPAPRKKSIVSSSAAKPLTWNEMDKLRSDLLLLPDDKLRAVAGIVGHQANSTQTGTEGELEIHFEKLEAVVLRKLQQFVRKTLKELAVGGKSRSKGKSSIPMSQVTSAVAVERVGPGSDRDYSSDDSDSSSSFESDSDIDLQAGKLKNPPAPVLSTQPSFSSLPVTPVTAGPAIVASQLEQKDTLSVQNTDAWTNLGSTQEMAPSSTRENIEDVNNLWQGFSKLDAEKKQRERELQEREEKAKLEMERREAEKKAQEEQRRLEQEERERQEKLQRLQTLSTQGFPGELESDSDHDFDAAEEFAKLAGQ